MQKAFRNIFVKLLFGLTIILLLTTFFLAKQISNTNAQVPPPTVPCSETDFPEYHSLRPYQKSPCETQIKETALFCGNQLVLQDSVSPSDGTCSFRQDGKMECLVTRTKSIAIDLSDADLPILGNTENVANSVNQSEGLDSAERTNEYVSWYLNGVPNKPESSFFDPDDEDDVSNLVNFSGPINKLLPREAQQRQRIATINSAGSSRHDQVVGCVYNFLGGFKKGKIVECYPQSIDKSPVRLSDWRDNLPPLESEIGSKYTDFKDYWIAYRTWEGNKCLRLPLFDIILCVNSPFDVDSWGNLWANIPLSSTEDRIGKVETDTFGVQPASENVEISDVSFTNQSDAELFFSHTEEAAELASILQKTYVPQGVSSTGGVSGISPSDFGSCDLTNIRTNPGDNLFAGEISGDLTYTARFTCDPGAVSCYEDCLAEGSTPSECARYPLCDDADGSSSCTKNVNVALSLETHTPKANEIWERTVAGSAAVFKRIFPKIGLGGPILGLLDMPAATKVTYTSADGTTVLAGSPQNQRSGEGAELYFPHFGGVEEYFLKGIQTALRPKGFGEPIASGDLGATSSNSNCDENAPAISLPRLISKENYYQLAVNWVAGGKEGTQALQCYNDAVGRAESSGVNAALLLWVWLNESGASNYNVASSVLDFGSVAAPPENFNAQIESFISTAQAYANASSHPACAGRSVTNLEGFAYLFATGTCDPNAPVAGFNETARGYYEKMVQGIGLVSSCSAPSGTTDTSCP